MIEQFKSRLQNSPEWIISICIFFVYWFVNRLYTGPAMLWDEIGYLTNAALISGHIIDGANSWHAGYSFFLAPLFIIFSEPTQVWQAVMVLNAFLWAVSFLLLAQIIRKLIPGVNKKQLVAALLISAIYPTWITMSGYALATTAFVFVYLLTILSLLYWKPDRLWTIIPHCLLVGYLYWIHPVGLAVMISSFIVVGLVSIRTNKHVPALVNFVFIIILVITYNEIVDKWLIAIATPEGYDPFFVHYPDSERIIGKMFNYQFWLHLVAKSFGQISYLIISSFGLIMVGFIASVNKSLRLIQNSNRNDDEGINFVNHSVFLYMILSLLGVLAMGVILFSGTASGVHHWIYGRYVEMVVLPLLALGCVSFWRKSWLFGAAIFIFITGVLLNQVADLSAGNHIYHTVAFWPQYLIHESNYIFWMTAGALALILAGRVWNDSRVGNVLVILLLVVLFVSSSYSSSKFHHSILAGYKIPYTFSGYSKPSNLVNMIRENYPPGTCIGFNSDKLGTLDNYQRERYHLKLFYLYDYDYRRMSPEEWLNDCNGPYFSYHLGELYNHDDVNLVGQEMFSGIYLLNKDDGSIFNRPELLNSFNEIYTANEWSVNYEIRFEGNQLTKLPREVGYPKEGSIYSTGEEGFLLLGPHLKIGSGKYKFILSGDISRVKDSWVKVLSEGKEYAKFNVNNNPVSNNGIIASGAFLLDEPVHNLEIRVYVGSEDNIRIDGYEIEYVSNED